jgi:hypothetical protein
MSSFLFELPSDISSEIDRIQARPDARPPMHNQTTLQQPPPPPPEPIAEVIRVIDQPFDHAHEPLPPSDFCTHIVEMHTDGIVPGVLIEWPLRIGDVSVPCLRRFLIGTETSRILPPVSISALVDYRVSKDPATHALRLVPFYDTRLVGRAVTLHDIARSVRCVHSESTTEHIMQYIHASIEFPVSGGGGGGGSPLLTDGQLRALVSVLMRAHHAPEALRQPLSVYCRRTFDWLDWREAGAEEPIARLAAFCSSTAFIEQIHAPPSESPFRRFVGQLCSDVLAGKNLLAHHLSNLIELEDIHRFMLLRRNSSTTTTTTTQEPSVETSSEWWVSNGCWTVARAELKRILQHYTIYDTCVIQPETEAQAQLYLFFVRQGMMIAAASSSPAGYYPNLINWHRRIVVHMLTRLIDVSSQQTVSEGVSLSAIEAGAGAAAIGTIGSLTELERDILLTKELAVIHNPCKTANGLLDSLCQRAQWVYYPSDAGERTFSVATNTAPTRLPLIVVRRLHFWTMLDLANLLLSAYASYFTWDGANERGRQMQFPKLVIEGDFHCQTQVCGLVHDATHYYLADPATSGVRAPLRGFFYQLSPAILESTRTISVYADARPESPLTQRELPDARHRFVMYTRDRIRSGEIAGNDTIKMLRELFHAEAQHRQPAGVLCPLRIAIAAGGAAAVDPGIELARQQFPAGFFVFQDMHALVATRHQLPMAASIYVCQSAVLSLSIEDLYMLCCATSGFVILETTSPQDLADIYKIVAPL